MSADTPVRVQGAGFHLALSTDLDEGTTEVVGCSATIGTMPLADLAWRSEQLIEGTVPAGMTLDTYDVTVTCGANVTTLPDAFTVTGDELPTGPWGTPTAVPELASAFSDDDPSITADRLELYFNSDRTGSAGGDIWVIRRPSVSDPWSLPSNVAELNSTFMETTPKVSPDGLAIYFSSDRTGSLGSMDIWVSTRATRSDPWTTPMHVPELCSIESDTGATVSASGKTIVISSLRDGTQDVYLATRAAVTDSWGTPMPIAELNTANYEADPDIARDERVFLFSSDRPGGPGPGDIYISTRASSAVPFDPPLLIPELNTAGDEEDPFVTDDVRYILFSSDRSGNFEIYEASR
jgi:hypothetical protein